MRLTFKVWKLIVVIELFDLDPSDRTVGLGLYISW